MPRGIAVASTASDGTHLFVAHGDNFDRGIFQATPTPEGDVTSWVELPLLPDGRVGPILLVREGRLVAFGGFDYDAYDSVSAVDTAAIAPDGTVGPWEPAEPLLQPRWLGTAANIDGDIVLVDGDDPSSFSVNEMERVLFDVDGVPVGHEVIGTAPSPHRMPFVTVRDERVQILGGEETYWTENAAWHHPLEGVAMFDTWAESGVLAAFYSQCVEALPSVLCLSTSSSLAGAGVISLVDFAPDGTLVETLLAPHPRAASAPGVVLVGGTVYFVGGYDATQPPGSGGLLSKAYYASVDALVRSKGDTP